MSFKLNKWGAEIANAKSLLDGVNYYRYEIPSGDTITTAGYFPKDLGLKLGDRIWCIPATKTDADKQYVVSNISAYGVITVAEANGQGGGDVDYSKVIVKSDTIPTAGADYAGFMYEYAGATNATYTHGYIYECVATPVYDSTVEFNPASLSGTTATCSGSDFAALVARWGTGAIDTIIKGTLTYDESGELLVFVGQDDTNTTVCTFQLYTQDYIDAGFTFTGTFQDGDVIAFTCTIEETGATYAWNRIDVQPQPAKELPTQAGNSGKFLKTNGVSASWGNALSNDGTNSTDIGVFVSGTNHYANGGNSIAIGANNVQASGSSAIALGTSAAALETEGVAIGAGARIVGRGSIAIGPSTQSNQPGSIALGASAAATGTHSIQISSGGAFYPRTNSDSNTFKVGNEYGNFEMMSANGTIPAARLGTLPTADGNYKLRLTISSGVATLSWVAE